jgi:hypothetical protein
MEDVAARIANGRADNPAPLRPIENWAAVRKRMNFGKLEGSRHADIRRAIGEVWNDPVCVSHAEGLVAHAFNAQQKSYDRALLQAYLRHFPRKHPAFPTLVSAVGTAAARNDWPWRVRGRRFRLWHEEEGPALLGRALLDAENPPGVLAETGLDGELALGRFVRRALQKVCVHTSQCSGGEAERLGGRLVALFESVSVGENDAMWAYGLLHPWRTATPAEGHRKAVSRVLVSRIGDPRLNPARWSSVLAAIPGDAAPLLATLKRWLTHSTVREFFKVVGRVTNNPEQWIAREKFWLGYLDAGVIPEAWFAFGRDAEHLAQSFQESGASQHGEITGGGAGRSHSVLILSIGDLRIAEWSHSGGCRFWINRDPTAPVLYQPQYPGTQLRAMSGGKGFERQFQSLDHRGAWQPHFAGFIYGHTGIRHPQWQEGHGAWR